MTTVTIYHNIATDEVGRPLGMLDGYTAGQPLVPVARYTAEGEPYTLLSAAFDTFNVGETGIAANYRSAGNRSLSVGDVVQVEDAWYACASYGWDVIDAPQWLAIGATTHGTKPLSRHALAGSLH